MNKLKLGKKKILGFMTAGAIVVTMAGSYATWDNLQGTSSVNVTLRKPTTVAVTSNDDVTYTETSKLGADELVYNSNEITFTPTDLPTNAGKTTLTVTGVAKKADGNVDTNVTVLVKEAETVGEATKSSVTTSFETTTEAAAGKGYITNTVTFQLP